MRKLPRRAMLRSGGGLMELVCCFGEPFERYRMPEYFNPATVAGLEDWFLFTAMGSYDLAVRRRASGVMGFCGPSKCLFWT
jgi:hypothetical protein